MPPQNNTPPPDDALERLLRTILLNPCSNTTFRIPPPACLYTAMAMAMAMAMVIDGMSLLVLPGFHTLTCLLTYLRRSSCDFPAREHPTSTLFIYTYTDRPSTETNHKTIARRRVEVEAAMDMIDLAHSRGFVHNELIMIN